MEKGDTPSVAVFLCIEGTRNVAFSIYIKEKNISSTRVVPFLLYTFYKTSTKSVCVGGTREERKMKRWKEKHAERGMRA